MPEKTPVLHKPGLTVGDRLFVGNPEEEKPECEENRKGSNRNIDGAARKLDRSDDRRAKEAGAFGEDIIDAEVFSGVFRRDDL